MKPSTASRNHSILLIADDRILRDFLHSALACRGYRLIDAATGAEGLEQFSDFAPEIVLLDPTLPDMDGLELLRTMRNRRESPIIVLSSRDQERTKVAALDAGADDYMTKPIGVEELLARIRAIFRRCPPPVETEQSGSSSELVIGTLRVDFERRLLTRDGVAVHLTPTEFRLLELLVQNRGHVMPHRELLDSLRGPGCHHDAQHLRVYIASLRKKIEENLVAPMLIRNVSGVGYRFTEEN